MNRSASQQSTWEIFRRNRPAFYSLLFVIFLFLFAVLAPFIANNKPIFFHYKGKTYFPVLSSSNVMLLDEKTMDINMVDWKKYPDATIIFPLIPYAPYQSDLYNSGYVAPGDAQFRPGNNNGQEELKGFQKHILGTGKRGEDTLAGLIHGTKISLSVGLLAMLIAGIIGIFTGAVAGYFGDEGLKFSRGAAILLLPAIIISWYYGFYLRSFILKDALSSSGTEIFLQLIISVVIFTLVMLLFYFIGKIISQNHYFSKRINFPVDSIVSRLIEILISLPRLILIISIAAIARPSILNLIFIIGLTSWTEIARFTRAEMMRIRSLDYISSAKSFGFTEMRIMFKHALPNAIGPALITIVFGIASAILIESGLSFLGIGVPQDIVTWGSLLASGRENFHAWWLVLFPGLAIFLTVTSYNLIGEGLRDAMDPRLRK